MDPQPRGLRFAPAGRMRTGVSSVGSFDADKTISLMRATIGSSVQVWI
jgi:hypothetical protein